MRLEDALSKRLEVESELSTARRALEDAETELRDLDESRLEAEQRVNKSRESMEAAKMAAQETRVRRESIAEQFAATRFELGEIQLGLPGDAIVVVWESKLKDVQVDIDRLGQVNLAAIDELKEQSERKEYLDSQFADLNSALETLEEAMRKIDKETRTRFEETFAKINAGLQAKFPRLFGGGHAYLEVNGEDPMQGISIMARPPGKRNSTIHQLSGGEGADRRGAGVLDLRPESRAVLSAGRGGRAARRAQRRPLLRHREGHVRAGAVHLHHPQQDHDGAGVAAHRRHHERAGRVAPGRGGRRRSRTPGGRLTQADLAMPELRWTLLVLGALFIAGLAFWEYRRQRHARGQSIDSRPGEGGDDAPRVYREPTLNLSDVHIDGRGGIHSAAPSFEARRSEARERDPMAELPVVEIDDDKELTGLRVDRETAVDSFSMTTDDDRRHGPTGFTGRDVADTGDVDADARADADAQAMPTSMPISTPTLTRTTRCAHRPRRWCLASNLPSR